MHWKIAKWMKESAEYTENLNLFSVAMGEYAESAYQYAEKVSGIMGIDPSDWLRNQGVFMTLATGFGVAGDRAATMSQQLTQLGYDLSSFFNIKVEDAMQKLQSGISGELEPLRRLGYDLSQAKLEATALSLGIKKSVSAMTQAEKAELRYYAILKQVTTAQGDMARTLNEPANQMRIFRAQVTQATRALGNIFIPVLNQAIPYVIAAIKVFTQLANSVASLFGFELDVDWGSSVASGASGASDAISDATDSAKQFKKQLLGIDELNVMSDNSSSSDSASYSGSGFDFDLPTYDFLGEATDSRVNEIVEKMKEWLGITDEITSWADLFETRLGDILIVVGLIGAGLAIWKIIESVANVVDVLGKLKGIGGKTKTPDVGGGTDSGDGADFSKTTAKLKTLAKDLALGIVIILEVAAAAALIVGAIWLLGVELEQVGIAWEPVIANGETIAIAMGLGTAILVSVGLITYALGSAGASVVGYMALGLATMALLGVNAALFLAEILVVGVLLNKIGVAWDPVLANGENIATAIGVGTGLLVGIGVVAAALGVATVATAGLLPVAIGLGTALLVELALAFVLFCDSLISVANKLVTLSKPMDKLNAILPGLKTDMNSFTKFMSNFASAIVKFTLVSAIASIAATIDKVISFFTTDPVKRMYDEVRDQTKDFEKLIPALEKINPLIKKATKLVGVYKTNMGSFESATGGSGGFLNSIVNGAKGVVNGLIGLFEGMANGVIKCVNVLIKGLNKISFEVPDWVPEIGGKKLGFNIKTISEVKIPRLADGGVVGNTGQLFVAREAGPELVANVGNKTAVMNNDQIVESVSRGVYQAVVSAMGQSGGTQVVEAKVNDKVLFEVVVDRNRRETMRTGASPLLGGV